MMDAHNYCRAYGGENMAACRIDDLNNLPGGECIKSSGEMKEEDIAARKKEAKEYLKRRSEEQFR